MSIIIGIDPGLQKTGWGVVKLSGNSLSFIACGTIKTKKEEAIGHQSEIADRLLDISTRLKDIISLYKPDEAAIEETFVNVNGQSTLKLGQARGSIILTLAASGLPVYEYAATLVKKSIVGAGRADKNQVGTMVQMLLPGCGKNGEDAMDALAIAICHSNHHKLY